jgi:cytidylate kinase
VVPEAGDGGRAMQTRISIAGDIGSGKSTIARAVASRIGVEPLSTGGIQRQLAAARGINTLELNRLAETDPSIDQQIDDYLRALPAGPLIVESRMAWHFVAGTRRVFLYIMSAAAAERILGASRSDESYRHLGEAVTLLAERRKSEIHRFQKYYAVDIGNLRNYDLIIDTTHVGIDKIVAAIFDTQETSAEPRALISPVDLVPTRGLDAAGALRLAELEKSIAERGFDVGAPIEVLYVDHTFFIAADFTAAEHLRVAAAIRAGLDLVPCRIAACEDEPYGNGASARQIVEAARADSLVDRWQATVGFRYKYPIIRG